MTRLLLIFIFTGAIQTISAQQKQFTELDFRDSVWYLNSVELLGFGEYSSSSLLAGVPDGKDCYILLKEKAEFYHKERSYSLPSRVFFHYLIYFTGSNNGYIRFAKKRQNLKHPDKSETYEFSIDQYELRLASSIMVTELGDFTVTKLMTFSKQKDSLQIAPKIIGNWKTSTYKNLLTDKTIDTIVLNKTLSLQAADSSCIYTFYKMDGELYCSSSCFNLIPEEKVKRENASTITDSPNRRRGLAPDPYYVSHISSDKIVDIAKDQITFQNGDVIYDILTIDEEQLILKRHPE